MNTEDKITDDDIRNVTYAFIQIANKTGELEEVMNDYKDKKSLAVMIIDSEFRGGFILADGKVRMVNDLDKPTVTVKMNKKMYWNIINSASWGLAHARVVTAIYTEESIVFDPPPGVGGGALHIKNVLKVFEYMFKIVTA